MRKINFIQKLVNNETIQLTESSKEICESYKHKSTNSLKAAKILIKQELIEEATSMSYYAMFHKAIALFRIVGVKCENHTATIILLKKLFNIDNTDISYAKEERIDKQYYTDFIITKEDAKDLINKAEKFIDELDIFIDKLTEEQRINYKEEFEKTYF